MKISTLGVTIQNINKAVSEGLLPIIINYNISGSQVVGCYSGTAIHFKTLSPDYETTNGYRLGLISIDEYKKRYIEKLVQVDLVDLKKKLEVLMEISGAEGICFFSFGEGPESCRFTLLEYLKSRGWEVENGDTN